MLNTVIFDMDGLLIDSEPLWQQAGIATLAHFGVHITIGQYYQTTGLRTKEWIEYWFTHFNLNHGKAPDAIQLIEDKSIENIRQNGQAFPGTMHILNFFKERNFTIGLATSSPLRLVDVVMQKLEIGHFFQAFSSAEYLPYGKPHPQVYINCAEKLGVAPVQCVCFEDSFNGLIAAKAAKMKCVAVPVEEERHQIKWGAADLRLSSLLEFNEELLGGL